MKQRPSTLLGINVDSNDEKKNGADSIRLSHEFDSNVTDESE
jgi:hypothetical protein